MRGAPTKVVCAECMKMCSLRGKNSTVKGLRCIILCITNVGQFTNPTMDRYTEDDILNQYSTIFGPHGNNV